MTASHIGQFSDHLALGIGEPSFLVTMPAGFSGKSIRIPV